MKTRPRTPEEIERRSRMTDSLPTDLGSLVAKLSDPDPEVRDLTVMALMHLDDKSAVSPLIRAFGDDDAMVRRSVALALGHYGSDDSLPVLIDHLLHDPSEHVRAMCTFGLGFSESAEAMDALAEALRDSDEHVRSSACYPFAHKKDSRAVSQMLGLLEDPVWQVRYTASVVLIQLGIGDQRIVQAISELSKQPEAEEHDAMVAQLTANYQEMLAEYDQEQHAHGEMSREELEETFRPPSSLAELLDQARKLLNSSQPTSNS